MHILMSTIAGLLAAYVSYFLNGRALKLLGEDAVTYGAPVIEETLKTGLAIAAGGGILFSHITFGLVEAAYDIFKNRGILQYTAGIAGLISHAVFGIITVYVWRFFGSPLVGVAIAIIIHMLWNHMIIHIRVKQ